MQDYHQLKVWEVSHEFAVGIFRISRSFPKEELYGITSQVRRAAFSIPINIAEGCGRHTSKDYAHFLDMAMGSASEVEEELLILRDIEFLDKKTHAIQEENIKKIKKMIAKLIDAVRGNGGPSDDDVIPPSDNKK